MKVKTECQIENKDLKLRYGKIDVETLAATLYNAFHGECQCVSHPFYSADSGDFHGTLPWDEDQTYHDDAVVETFRVAAYAVRDILRSNNIGVWSM